MASPRRTLTVAGAFAMLASGAPRLVMGQPNRQQQQPGADAVRILIATFRAPPNQGALGVDAAEAIRTRVQQENPIRQVWVLPRNDINNYLTSSGYKADSALSASDLKELAKLMRADEIVDGAVSRTGNGVRVEARLILARDISLAQPLPPVEAKDPGGAARQVAKELSDARKQLPEYRKCEAALRDQKYTEAANFARAGLARDANGNLSRLCLMSAYQYGKLGSDSVIKVAEEILKSDSTNVLALRNAVDAYQQKGDTAKGVQSMVRLARVDPSIRQQLLSMLGAMNRPDIALPIANEMLQDNPGDPQLLRMKWVLLLAAKDWAKAREAGEEYVKADTNAANVDYYRRSIVAALQDNQPQLAGQIAARGVQKFATNAELQMLYAQALRRAGQLQQSLAAAERAVELNANVENGVPLILVTYSELKQPDNAIIWAKKAVAAGTDKETVGQGLLPIIGAAVKEAQAAQNAADGSPENANKRQLWLRAYQLASAVDSIAPSPNTKFFIGVSSFYVGLDALQGLNKSKSCPDAQLVEDMWAAAQIAMPQGAAVDKNSAGQILGAIQQYSSNIAPAKKAFCKSATSRSGTNRGDR